MAKVLLERLLFNKVISGPTLLYIQARIDRNDTTVAPYYCLALSLDGIPLTPDNVKVLNKSELSIPVGSQFEKRPLYSAEQGAWALVASENPISPAPYPIDAALAYTSHYYEYVLLLNEIPVGESHEVVIESVGDEVVRLIDCEVKQAECPVIVSSSDWMRIVFPWQTPNLNEIGQPLKITRALKEREPVAFDVFALEKLEQVTVRVTGLPSTIVDIRYVETIYRSNLGEASFIASIDFIPEAYRRRSPEMLRPIGEEPLTIQQHTTKRFILDVTPTGVGQTPGNQRGDVHIYAGENHIISIPLYIETLPFELESTPQKYWMWRLQWTPAWNPENVACINDIRDHGFDGLVRTAGAKFLVSYDTGGNISVSGSEYQKLLPVLAGAGMGTRIADDAVALAIIRTVAARKGITFSKVADLSLLSAEQRAIIEPDAISAFSQIKSITAALGITVDIFPIDEPDGGATFRAWTAYISDLAHKGGLGTWSTQNTFSWGSGIDKPCIGETTINKYYLEDRIVSGGFLGQLAVPFMPWIGGFRAGADYHWNGLIRDVRIYNRPLTDAQMRAQHSNPAAGSIAYYPLTADVNDYSGNGYHGTISGGCAPSPDGLVCNGVDGHVVLPNATQTFSAGWSISMWYQGAGSPFGKGYDLYLDGQQIRFTTTEESRRWFAFGSGNMDSRFWNHIAISFDNAAKTIKVSYQSADARAWYRENIEWMYCQVRSMPPKNPRFKMGVQSFFYGNTGRLTNITAMGYDWNTSNLYLVYPKSGNRMTGAWYPTLGWLATREGIDDARYLQTLVTALKRYRGMTRANAVATVIDLIKPITASYEGIDGVINHFGGYGELREFVTATILKIEGDS